MLLYDLIANVSVEDREDVVLDYLNNNSPSKEYEWLFDKGFYQVTIPYTVLDDYLVFVEKLVKCKYTFQEDDTGECISLLFSL